MGRRSNKDILLGLVGTLSDEECKDIYYLIVEEKKSNQPVFLEFDRVQLTQSQYSKLIWMWGKDKTDSCIKILNEWMAKKDITKRISCYKALITWVDNAYYRTHPTNDKSLRFNSDIDTAWKAKRYIERIPKDLRAYDSEVKFLIEKFGTKILIS